LLLARPNHGVTSIFSAIAIFNRQKSRAKALRTRARLNETRLVTGKRPVQSRLSPFKPYVYSSLFLASRQLYAEAKDYMYMYNHFGISLDSFIITDPRSTIHYPSGWDLSRITKLVLELQLRDAQRMNRYVDWERLFSWFPELRMLRIVPTFHPRYYEWAQDELKSWDGVSFVWKAFFKSLLHEVPRNVKLKVGAAGVDLQDLAWGGKGVVSTAVLHQIVGYVGGQQEVVVDFGEY